MFVSFLGGAVLNVAEAQSSSSGTGRKTSPPKKNTRKVAIQKGVITVPEASVFQEADFDGAVIGSLSEGAVYDISVKKKDTFYRIRVRPGLMGWISEAEVQPVSSGQAKRIQESRKQAVAEANAPPKRQRARKEMDRRRFRGLGLETVNFSEKTMGKTRQESLLFYGVKFSGPDTLFEGEIETDSELLFHSGAPGYYQQATGNPASGFILMGNFLFQTTMPQGDSMMAFYGFGPSFRLAHFNVELSNDPTAGNKRSYTLDDMTLGAVFNLGASYALGDYALRIEGRYYWETQQYTSFGLAIQKEF